MKECQEEINFCIQGNNIGWGGDRFQQEQGGFYLFREGERVCIVEVYSEE